jgi:solute carrier family 38 (sodium-coupled neutral amino acid transporter), member 11
MFQLSKTRRDRNGVADTEHAQPLLSSTHNRDVATDSTVFSVQDFDDETEETALDSARTDHTVRFQEEVHVIGPPLRSTLASREAGVCVSSSA